MKAGREQERYSTSLSKHFEDNENNETYFPEEDILNPSDFLSLPRPSSIRSLNINSPGKPLKKKKVKKLNKERTPPGIYERSFTKESLNPKYKMSNNFTIGRDNVLQTSTHVFRPTEVDKNTEKHKLFIFLIIIVSFVVGFVGGFYTNKLI